MENNRNAASGESKYPASTMRWLGILVRTGHIGVAAVFFGGCVLDVPFARLTPWHHLTLASGGSLLLLEWLHDARWPHRGKGLLGILHVCLGTLIPFSSGLAVPLLWGILLTGGIGSHMPRRFRHWSILEGSEVRQERDEISPFGR